MTLDGRSLKALQIDQLCGTIAHRVVAGSLRRHGLRPASVVELADLVRAEELPVRRNAASAIRAHAVSSAAVYLRRMAPPAGAELVGVEQEVPGGRLDLVWEQDGVLWSDELKCGRTQTSVAAETDTRQLSAQLTGARQVLEGPFAGIRVCLICAPRQSFFWDGRAAGVLLDEQTGAPLTISQLLEQAHGAPA